MFADLRECKQLEKLTKSPSLAEQRKYVAFYQNEAVTSTVARYRNSKPVTSNAVIKQTQLAFHFTLGLWGIKRAPMEGVVPLRV